MILIKVTKHQKPFDNLQRVVTDFDDSFLIEEYFISSVSKIMTLKFDFKNFFIQNLEIVSEYLQVLDEGHQNW